MVSHAQKLDFSEIMTILDCREIECYKKIAIDRKFCYDTIVADNSADFYRYSSCDYYYFQKDGIKTKNYISFGIKNTSDSKCICFTLVTSSKEYYDELMSKIKRDYVQTENTGSGKHINHLIFINEPLSIKAEIITTHKTLKSGSKYPVYTFYFHKVVSE